jgi:hypothetical protein
MLPDCASLSSDTLTAACWQAESAASAALTVADGAFWQAWLTFIAGALAAAGGFLAYLAATRESRRLDSVHRARTSAYRFMLRMKAQSLRDDAAISLSIASEQLANYRDGDTGALQVHHIVRPPEFMPDQFERHALLGLEAQRAIHDTDEAADAAYRIADQMRNKTVNEPYGIKEGSRTEHPDGSVTFEGDIAVSQYALISRVLVNAVTGLIVVLEEQGN